MAGTAYIDLDQNASRNDLSSALDATFVQFNNFTSGLSWQFTTDPATMTYTCDGPRPVRMAMGSAALGSDLYVTFRRLLICGEHWPMHLTHTCQNPYAALTQFISPEAFGKASFEGKEEVLGYQCDHWMLNATFMGGPTTVDCESHGDTRPSAVSSSFPCLSLPWAGTTADNLNPTTV